MTANVEGTAVPPGTKKEEDSLIERAKRIFRGENLDDAEAQAAATAWKKRNYDEKLPDDIDEFRSLLQDYSKIPRDQIDEHLRGIRDKAWAITPYPCLGNWSFVSLKQTRDRRAKAAMARLKREDSEDVLLDLGCCVAQFLRKLVHEGVPPGRLCGTDLHAEFIEIGYELFRDREQWKKESFVAGDLLLGEEEEKEEGHGGEGTGLAGLDGRFTMVHAANLFHLFNWTEQVVAGQRIVRFLKPGAKDVMIFGGQIGTLTPGDEGDRKTDKRYLHDAKSFQQLWDEVGAKTGTKWRVEMDLKGKSPFLSSRAWASENPQYFLFGVYQIQNMDASLLSKSLASLEI